MENHVVSGSLVRVAQSIFQAADEAREVITQKENFNKFSSLLKRMAFILQEFSKLEVKNSEYVKKAVVSLEVEINAAKRLISSCSEGNQIYLLLSCKRIVEELERSTKNISQGLCVLTLGSLDVSSETQDRLMNLCKDMAGAHFQVSAMEREIMQKIEAGVEERNADRSYASDLLVLIFECIGILNEQSEMKTQFESFKNEVERIELKAEALRMEQIILLLGNAETVTSPKEKEMKYLIKRNSLGRRLLEPLQSFYCPITADVMVDPVESPSGQTFERSAIEKWLAEGNHLCPMTKTPLNALSLRPNKTLKQSIEEWRNRNTMISIASMKPEIQSCDEQESLSSLKKLCDLSERSAMHREWIVMEDYIPIVTGLLSAKNSELRVHALAILCRLAKDADENKVKIAEVKDSTKYIVRLLARKVEESTLALQLLLELSTIMHIRNHIGHVQGCILLLVTLASSDNAQASEYAHQILDNLSFLDENVIQMAMAKFFKPLLQRLSQGPLDMKMKMADTLASIELTDHNKLCLSRYGALKLLLEMLRHDDIEVKAMAVKALQNVAGVASNGIQLIKEGAKDPLFELLFCHTLSLPKLREQVAKTIMYLAMSTSSPEASVEHISLLDTEDDIFKLFSLVSYTGPDMQETILLTFHTICKSPSGFGTRNYLRQISAVKVLIQLCEVGDLSVRSNAVKLFHYLTEDGEHETFLEHVNERCISALVKIIKTSDNEEETAAAMGIIAHLPCNTLISQHILDAGALDVIVSCLNSRNILASHETVMIESAAEALCRFTVPSNLEWQKRVAEAGMISVLVNLLTTGSCSSKVSAAISLKQLSESSSKLSLPVKKGSIFSCCFASPEKGCPIHLGICGVETSFCLLEAEAVRPLVIMLGETDTNACEASLDAILTLIEGIQLQNGCKVLEEAGAVTPIIKMLNSCSSSLQEKALGALQRIFRFVEFKTKYGKSAQMSLVDITQRGSSNAKSLAAKILAQLNVLNEQSSFFDSTA